MDDPSRASVKWWVVEWNNPRPLPLPTGIAYLRLYTSCRRFRLRKHGTRKRALFYKGLLPLPGDELVGYVRCVRWKGGFELLSERRSPRQFSSPREPPPP